MANEMKHRSQEEQHAIDRLIVQRENARAELYRAAVLVGDARSKLAGTKGQARRKAIKLVVETTKALALICDKFYASLDEALRREYRK